MAFSELERQRIKRDVGALCKRRSPAHMRDQLRHDYAIDGHSVILSEIRPHWKEPTKFFESPYAKITYVRSQKVWKLYWMRADQRFYRYTPRESSQHLSDLVAEIDADRNACFFG